MKKLLMIFVLFFITSYIFGVSYQVNPYTGKIELVPASADQDLNSTDDVVFSSVTTTGAVASIISADDSTYVFARTGDLDTGINFDFSNTRYEFHRDGGFSAAISAEETPTYAFRASGVSTNAALLIPSDAYAFTLTTAQTTGLYFDVVGGDIEIHQAGSDTHNFGVATGLYSNTGGARLGKGVKHDGYYILDASEVQTTNATTTTLQGVGLLDENTYHFNVYIIGVKSDGTDRASYILDFTAYRTGGGNATLQGAIVATYTSESNAAWNATAIVSSTNIVLRVTGAAATTIEWGATVKYINMSN